MFPELDLVILSRLQFALTAMYHFLFVPLTLGLSLLLAITVAFLADMLVNLAAFWLLEIRGVMILYVVTSGVLCGLYLPVHWFPPWLSTLAAATPFPSMLQTPVDLLTGRLATPSAAVGALAVQLAWAVGMLALGRLVLAVATRRLVVQGG